MLEAVNSVIANASVLRQQGEQAAVSGSAVSLNQSASGAASPEPLRAPYISPYVHMDLNYDVAVLQLRDSDTGDVLRQIPSETRLQADQRAKSAEAEVQEIRAQSKTPDLRESSANDIRISYDTLAAAQESYEPQGTPAFSSTTTAPVASAQQASAALQAASALSNTSQAVAQA